MEREGKFSESYDEMVVPTLSKMKFQSLGLHFPGEQMFTKEDFHAIKDDCLSLYQTEVGMKKANFLTHLRNYDAPEGLRLATAQMMVQGYINGGDILRMANNIVKLKQAQVKVETSAKYKEKKMGLQVYTASLDDFTEHPEMSAYMFLNYIFREYPHVSTERKETVARKYGVYYREKRKNSLQYFTRGKAMHFTHRKGDDSEGLKEYLRQDAIFGPPLSKIGELVRTALKSSRADLSKRYE